MKRAFCIFILSIGVVSSFTADVRLSAFDSDSASSSPDIKSARFPFSQPSFMSQSEGEIETLFSAKPVTIGNLIFEQHLAKIPESPTVYVSKKMEGNESLMLGFLVGLLLEVHIHKNSKGLVATSVVMLQEGAKCYHPTCSIKKTNMTVIYYLGPNGNVQNINHNFNQENDILCLGATEI